MRKNNESFRQNHALYKHQLQAPTARTMPSQSNGLHLFSPESSIATTGSSSMRRHACSEADDDQSTASSSESNTDLDFFQTCTPTGTGFALDCWTTKPSDDGGARVVPVDARSSQQNDDDDCNWNESCSEEDDGECSTASASRAEDDHDDTSDCDQEILPDTSGQRTSLPCQLQLSEQEQPSDEQQGEEIPCDSDGGAGTWRISGTVPTVKPALLSTTATTTTSIISSARHVHFGASLVTAHFRYPRPSDDDFFRLYYSAHELQRLLDQYKIDICSTGKAAISETNEATNTALAERVDFCPDYPAW